MCGVELQDYILFIFNCFKVTVLNFVLKINRFLICVSLQLFCLFIILVLTYYFLLLRSFHSACIN